MPRPLVWVGVAYTLGAAWAAGEQKLFYGIAGLALCMWITGRIRQSWTRKWLFWLLPVFFVSGFVIFSRTITEVKDNTLENHSITVQGIVRQCEEKEKVYSVILSDVILSGKKKKMLLYISKDEMSPEVGDCIKAEGVLEKPDKARNPGQFDAETYYTSKGIAYMMRPERILVVNKGCSFSIWLQRLRQFWARRYDMFLNTGDAGVVRAVVMGDKSEMDEETEQLYIQAGIVHVLAISGLHISIIGMGLFSLLKKLGAGLKGSACLASVIVFSYGMMTGFGPSTQRAVIMFLVRMGAVYLGCTYDFLSAVSLAALILFVTQPFVILQNGVWFSFSAVLSIGVLWPAMERCIPWQYEKVSNYKMQHLKKSMGLKTTKREYLEKMLRYSGPSLAVTIGTIPLTAFCYGAIPLVSVLLNLLVLPLMNIFVPMAIGSAGVSLFSKSAALFCGGSLHFILQINRCLCEKLLRLPFAVWRTGVPPVSWVMIYYAILVAFVLLSFPEVDFWSGLRFGSRLESCRGLLLVLCLFIFIPVRKMQPMTAFLDVGQGDGIFVRTSNGITWLIDGGSSDVKEVGKYRILPFLNYYGEDGVDYACVTHGDADHISGIRELLQAKKIRHLVMTEIAKTDETSCELAKLAAENDIEIIYVQRGSSWDSGGWHFECLYPGKTTKTDNINDTSMVLRVNVGETAFLMTGDITGDAEETLDEEKIRDIDVLKVAHHGSKYSSSEIFLKKIGAKVAVISCGKDNRYGHPAPETLERLKVQNMKIYTTMDKGAVLMFYQKGMFLLKTWLNS